jgi:hypothetical protein
LAGLHISEYLVPTLVFCKKWEAGLVANTAELLKGNHENTQIQKTDQNSVIQCPALRIQNQVICHYFLNVAVGNVVQFI